MPASECKVRGIGFLGLIAVANHLAEGGFAAVRGRLPATHLGLFDEPIHEAQWYPLAAFDALLQAIDQTVGNGDGQIAYDIGVLAADLDQELHYRLNFNYIGVDILIQRCFAMWRRYYSHGHWSISKMRLDPKDPFVEVAVMGFSSPSRCFCRNLHGWVEKFMHLSLGEKLDVLKPSVAHAPCVHDGAAHCGFQMRWTTPPNF